MAILLPTLNGEADLEKLVPALDRQRLAHARIAVDSSSDDATVERLEAAGFSVTKITREEFGHGRTRNLLASLTDADFLVFLSQDATPVDADFLEALLRPFDDPSVGGAIARVLPYPDDDPLTARTVLSSPEAATEPETKRWRDPEAYGTMGPRERAELLRFNNVASCIRREALQKVPFPEVPFGEDFAWAMRALAAGWALRFEPAAVVYHAHQYSPSTALKRYQTDAIFHREFHGNRIRPTVLSFLKGSLYETKEDIKFLLGVGDVARSDRTQSHRQKRRGFWKALLLAPFLRFAQTYGQYRGSSQTRSSAAETAAWAQARAAGAIGLTADPADSVSPVQDTDGHLAGGHP